MPGLAPTLGTNIFLRPNPQGTVAFEGIRLHLKFALKKKMVERRSHQQIHGSLKQSVGFFLHVFFFHSPPPKKKWKIEQKDIMMKSWWNIGVLPNSYQNAGAMTSGLGRLRVGAPTHNILIGGWFPNPFAKNMRKSNRIVFPPQIGYYSTNRLMIYLFHSQA